jgi:hypothetical protein
VRRSADWSRRRGTVSQVGNLRAVELKLNGIFVRKIASRGFADYQSAKQSRACGTNLRYDRSQSSNHKISLFPIRVIRVIRG